MHARGHTISESEIWSSVEDAEGMTCTNPDSAPRSSEKCSAVPPPDRLISVLCYAKTNAQHAAAAAHHDEMRNERVKAYTSASAVAMNLVPEMRKEKTAVGVGGMERATPVARWKEGDERMPYLIGSD